MSLLLCMVLWFATAWAADDVPAEDDLQVLINETEDYRKLERLADEAKTAGDTERARRLYEGMLQQMELSKYLSYRGMLSEALVLERLGDHDASAEKYREGIQDDVLRATIVLNILSTHPERNALLGEARAMVDAAVAEAEAGGSPHIYTTSKGASRSLKLMTQDELIAAGGKGKYCYIAELDLTSVAPEDMPDSIELTRCVVGTLRAADQHIPKLVLRGFAYEVQIGKQWTGEKNKSSTIKPASFDSLAFREAVIYGEANFAGVEVRKKTALFPFAVFNEAADFKGAEFWGPADFRFASFGGGANFKDVRMHEAVYFGGTVYLDDTIFTGLTSDRFVYFNSARFEQSATFEKCEWFKGATFEDSRFDGPVSLATSMVHGRLNMSRVVFYDDLSVKEVKTLGLDMVGTVFKGNASFTDAHFDGKVRFSLDDVTRARHLQDPRPLLALYRDYQGDEDADEPLTTSSSYGVEGVDDLVARVEQDISFANTVFTGYAVFERVTFGQEGQKGRAQFYNTQFLGESHFERTTFHAAADFTTIFGNEVAFNEALFNDTLILDDANVPGRITMTDARFAPGADWSFYGAEIRTFQVADSHVTDDEGDHLLFYEKCALDRGEWRDDMRIERLPDDLTDTEIRALCYESVIDEFVGLKDSFGDRAMIDSEDDAYWWGRHHETMYRLRHGDAWDRVASVSNLVLFELTFGWGVRLGNLGIASLFITTLFAVLYRVFCADTVLAYDGEDIRVRDVSFAGLWFVSLQSLLAINTGWDFGDDDHRFRYLNTAETLVGFVILTFFVGAYTRMILA
jgi:uncharacterized protein YjbI with pentapeptide repeats